MPVGVSAWTPLAFTTIGTATWNVTFSSIPSTYRDLVLVINGATASFDNRYALVFNGDVGTTTYWMNNMATGGNATSSNTNLGRFDTALSWSLAQATGRSGAVVEIQEYSATNKSKSILARSTSGNVGSELVSGRWASNAAVNSVRIQVDNNAIWYMVAGTTIALYGVSA